MDCKPQMPRVRALESVMGLASTAISSTQSLTSDNTHPIKVIHFKALMFSTYYMPALVLGVMDARLN